MKILSYSGGAQSLQESQIDVRLHHQNEESNKIEVSPRYKGKHKNKNSISQAIGYM